MREIVVEAGTNLDWVRVGVNTAVILHALRLFVLRNIGLCFDFVSQPISCQCRSIHSGTTYQVAFDPGRYVRPVRVLVDVL